METAAPCVTTVPLFPEAEIRSLRGTVLSNRAVELHSEVVRLRDVAVSAVRRTIDAAVALGQIFDEAFRRYDGEFRDWLLATYGENAEGRPNFHEQTARRYRTLFNKRDLIYRPDGLDPECRTLTDAMIKCEIIPAAAPVPQPPPAQTFFRINTHFSEVPPEKWPREIQLAYLQETEPIVKTRDRLTQLVLA